MIGQPMNQRDRLSQDIVLLCQEAYKRLRSEGTSKHSKTFFGSKVYKLIRSLIHLHSPQLNLNLKAMLKACAISEKGEACIFNQHIIEDIDSSSEWKNNQSFQLIWVRAERLIRYLLFEQCRGKSQLQLQNIYLELQCSLNYTCPICIEMSQSQSQAIKSMKELESQDTFKQQASHTNAFHTMRNISQETNETDERVGKGGSKSKLDDIFDYMRKERHREMSLKHAQKKEISKVWKNYGQLMGLDREYFEQFNGSPPTQSEKTQLFRVICGRNRNNRRMINDFCDKVKRISKAKLSRSISIKCREKQEEDEENRQRKKLWSMKEMQKTTRNIASRRLTPKNNQQNLANTTIQLSLGGGRLGPTMKPHKIQIGSSTVAEQAMRQVAVVLRRKEISFSKNN